MKKNDIQKLRTKSALELEEDLTVSREKLGVLGFDLASGKVKNTSEMRDLKKRIARILSFLKEKSIKS